MKEFPHAYRASATGGAGGSVGVRANGAAAIDTWPPPEFEGPPGQWSPESLLVAAVADCFVLSFRAVARASRLEWERLDVDVQGVLDRVDGVTRFTKFTITPRLTLARDSDASRAPSVLEKAKRVCLVTNSLSAECTLDLETAVTPAAVRA